LSFGKNNDLYTKAIIRLHHLNLIESSIWMKLFKKKCR
jgi:hypothetical protein